MDFRSGDSRPLESAVRNRPEIFKDQLTRDFVADIISGGISCDARKQSKGFKQRNEKIIERILFLRGLGINLGGNNSLTCYKLISIEFNIKTNTIKELWLNKNKYQTVFTPVMFVKGACHKSLNNGHSPLSVNEIQLIEGKWSSLDKSEKDKICSQITGE